MNHPKWILPVVLLALLSVAVIGGTEPEFPEWFIVGLGLLLPWLFNAFICKLPGWLKPLVAYGLSGAIACAAGFLFAGWRTLPDVLRNLMWLYAITQFVYDIMVRGVQNIRAKTAQRARDKASQMREAGKH